jgi:hypothetical protein
MDTHNNIKFGKSLCTYRRFWKWCPRTSIQAWTPLILFANTFCRSAGIALQPLFNNWIQWNNSTLQWQLRYWQVHSDFRNARYNEASDALKYAWVCVAKCVWINKFQLDTVGKREFCRQISVRCNRIRVACLPQHKSWTLQMHRVVSTYWWQVFVTIEKLQIEKNI